MEKKPLTPRKVVSVKGRIHYLEGSQAWGNIKLKKELINEFPQLKERRSNFSYELLAFRVQEDIDKAIKELAKKGEVIPLLLFFYKEGEENKNA